MAVIKGVLTEAGSIIETLTVYHYGLWGAYTASAIGPPLTPQMANVKRRGGPISLLYTGVK